MRSSLIGLCLSFYFAFLGPLVAQEQSLSAAADITVVPPSPNVSAFNKFIDIPVSLYTGTPNVSVPIYTIQMQQLSLPISLSYHASGLKVEEHASWVGAGWVLNATGNINRTARGLPDEYKLDHYKKGYFYHSELFTTEGNIDYSYVNQCDAGTAQLEVHSQLGPISNPDLIARGLRDSEPDLFVFSMPGGGSGKFLFDKDRDIVRSTKDNIRILKHPFVNISPLMNGLSDYEWEIQSSNGTIYKYKKAERTKVVSRCVTGTSNESFSGPYSGPDNTFYQNTWYLEEISLGSEWIRFEYANETIQYETKLSESQQFTYYVSGTEASPAARTTCFNDTEVQALRLQKITTSNGDQVDFIANQSRLDLLGSHKLDEIRVSKYGVFVKAYRLNNSYYAPNDVKLRLDSVEPVDENNNPLSGYTFQYYSGALPSTSSKSQDYWGYFNGASNSSLITDFKQGDLHVNKSSMSNRSPVLDKAKIGTLEKLYYPTGGHTLFEYELHDYYDANAQKEYYECAVANATEEITHNFTVAQDAYASITISGYTLSSLHQNTQIRRLNPSTGQYEGITLTPSNPFMLSRKILPAGSYQLYARNTVSAAEMEADGFDINAIDPVSICLEYEQDEAQNVSVGGLRLKQMTFFDPQEDRLTKKKFTYRDLNSIQSSGLLFSPALLGGHTTDKIKGSVSEMGICMEVSLTSFLNLSSQPQIPMAIYQGSHMGYSVVLEAQIEETNQSSPLGLGGTVIGQTKLGETRHEFINTKSSDSEVFPYPPQRDLGFKNGQPLRQTLYKVEGTQSTKVQETIYHYEEAYQGSEEIVGLKMTYRQNNDCYTCDESVYAKSEYRIRPTWHRLVSTTTRNFDASGTHSLESVTEYFYDPSQTQFLPIAIEKMGSRQEIIREELSRDPNHPALITERIVKIKPSGGVFTQIQGEQLSYQNTLPTLFKQWDEQLNQYVKKKAFAYISGERIATITNYPVDTPPGLSGLQVAYVWGYNHSYPVAKIEGASYSEVLSAVTLNQTILDNPASASALLSELDKLRQASQLSNTFITTYTYKPGIGIENMVDPNGKKMSYEYDGFGRLSYIQDQDGSIVKTYEYHYASEGTE